MMFSQQLRSDYPLLYTWMFKRLAAVPNNLRVFNAFVLYSELTRTKARTILTKCTEHPTIDYRVLDTDDRRVNGRFRRAAAPNTVYLAKTICERFENSAEARGNETMQRFVESTVLHELCHWGDYLDGTDQTDEHGDRIEEGRAFETAAYGRNLNRPW